MTVGVAVNISEEKISRPIFLSLLLHATFALLVFLLFQNHRNTDLSRREPLELEVVNVDSAPKILEPHKKQVVETELLKETKETTKDAYLSEKTQKVLRQTKAAKVASFTKQRAGSGKAGTESALSSEKSSVHEFSDIVLAPHLKPLGHLNPAEREQAVAASSNDYLKNVIPGAQTLLNTKEFAYFSFYQRIRRQLEQYWEPGLRKRLRSMVSRGRMLASEKEHATKILVTISVLGSITKVQVADTSGVLDLDQAAVDAFNRAGPFPNPPQGMVERDGFVRVEWEFVLKT